MCTNVNVLEQDELARFDFALCVYSTFTLISQFLSHTHKRTSQWTELEIPTGGSNVIIHMDTKKPLSKYTKSLLLVDEDNFSLSQQKRTGRVLLKHTK